MSLFHWICISVGTLLTVASVITALLCHLKPQNQTYSKVKVIVRSWWIICAPFLLALSWPKWGMLLLFYILSCLIIFEYFKVSKVSYKRYGIISLLILTTLQYLALSLDSFYLFTTAIPVLCLWLIPGLVIFRATIKDLDLVFSVFFGNAFIIYYLSHIPAITAMPDKVGLTMDQATLGLVVLLVLTWGNDVFQFLAGKSFGKRKIVPEVSPNKTLAGFIGGICCTTLLALVIMKPVLNLSWTATLILAPLISATGMFGDLFFSAVKRRIGTKDFSEALPGHGGLLDRCDSIIFTAPLFFHFMILLNRGIL